MGRKTTLENFKLYYEDIERKPVKTVPVKQTKQTSKKVTPGAKRVPKDKASFGDKMRNISQGLRSRFDNAVKSYQTSKKKRSKLTKTQKRELRAQKLRGIIGIGLLFVVVSIAYSTYMTNLFVDGTMMIIALAPQVIFAVITLLIAFYKIYK